ncbi:MAG: Flp pilus assembly complex ATPase component TadA [Phycisphaerae bacterium]|nr:Flp pilus assembly complex ATPase component TadA [Phycisphaerae bacterium]
MLLKLGYLSDEQLSEGLALQRRQSKRLGELLCQLGHVDEQMVREALVRQSHLPEVDLETFPIDPQAAACIPAEAAFRHKVLPLAVHERTLDVAMADPFDRGVIESLRVLTGFRIERFYCPEAILLETARRIYGSNVARMIADLDGAPAAATGEGGEEELSLQLQELAREPSVVNLVNLILLEAIDSRASDVHIEPFEKTLKIKYRIDGVLHEMSPPPKRLQPAIISRVKVMAGMNIAERFVPQDGHIAFTSPRGKVDLRVATVPTIFGESVVLRILDRSTALIDMEHLGLNPACLKQFSFLLQRPHGIVLVTGPTGSGKTTTLYAALNRIYTPEKKIITIEDPVEYQLEGVNQIPVNRKRGLTFADGLRAIVRQDPDIIMIGEIRDRETADIAIRSAMTGHLVFSTLHTNDAPGAVTRLLDMGVEPFLLASSLEGVLAQRLVRMICPECKAPYPPDEVALQRMGPCAANAKQEQFFHGEGCRSCRQSGYAGRNGIFELLRITAEVRDAITRRCSADQISAVAPADHQPMRQDGYRKAVEGLTTLEEVLRVTQDTQVDEAIM